MPHKLRMVLLVIIASLIGVCFLISASYAYFTINPIIVSSKVILPKNGDVVALFEKKALKLSGDFAKPISDINAFVDANHLNRLFISNNKNEKMVYRIYLVPTTNSKIPNEMIKYAIYDLKNERPAYGTSLAMTTQEISNNQQVLITKMGYTPTNYAYQLADKFTILPGETTTLDLYLWVGTSELVTDYDSKGIFEGVILIISE